MQSTHQHSRLDSFSRSQLLSHRRTRGETCISGDVCGALLLKKQRIVAVEYMSRCLYILWLGWCWPLNLAGRSPFFCLCSVGFTQTSPNRLGAFWTIPGCMYILACRPPLVELPRRLKILHCRRLHTPGATLLLFLRLHSSTQR